MREKLDGANISMELLVRYIDDIRAILKSLAAGAMWREGRVEIDREMEEQDLGKEDPRLEATARVLKDLMNSITDGIQFTAETKDDFREM